jgi:hypothetical protein
MYIIPIVKYQSATIAINQQHKQPALFFCVTWKVRRAAELAITEISEYN